MRWEVNSPNWTKVIDVKNGVDLEQQVADLIVNDDWPERVDASGHCWVWAECTCLVTGEVRSFEVRVDPGLWGDRYREVK